MPLTGNVLAWSPILYLLVMALVCMRGVWLGAWETRLLAGCYAAASLASLAAVRPPWARPQWGVAAIDLAFFLLAVVVIFRSRRLWPVLIGAAQLLVLATHGAFAAAGGHLGADAYFTVLAVWTYAIILCLAGATWDDRRGARRQPPA